MSIGTGDDRRAKVQIAGIGPALMVMGIKMASGNDMKAANATYEGFIGMLKWSVPLVAVIAAFVVVIIQ